MKRLLFNTDTPPGLPPAPAPTPPPAAELVIKSDAKESDAGELVRLRQERQELAAKLKVREMEAAELQDTVHRLRTPPAPASLPKRVPSPNTVWEMYDTHFPSDETPAAT